jgi:glucose/arabinose dehydrogenase
VKPAGGRGARRSLAALLAAACVLGAAPGGAARAAAPRPRTVVSGLEFPTAIAFDARGRMYVGEKPGRVRVVRGGELRRQPLVEVPTTVDALEQGLLGLAVSPDDRFVYLYATEPDGATNSVMRVPTTGGRPEVIVDGLTASVYHNGGGLAFDRGGMLLVSHGDSHGGEVAQDPAALGGKVYRLTPAGAPAPDNPFGDSPALAIGLRNPFGLAIDPLSGAAFVTENGPEADDEINRVDPGTNHGWPLVTGRDFPADGTVSGYRPPLLEYPEIVVPTGLAFAPPGAALPAYAGDLFFGTYGEQTVHRVRLDADRSEALSDDIFVREDEPVLALAWGPEGLYYSTPTAVKVVGIARGGRPRSGGGQEGAALEPASEAPPAASDESGDAGPLLALAAGAAAAVAVLLVVLRERRRRPPLR